MSQGFAAPLGNAAARDSIEDIKSRLQRIEQQLSRQNEGENPAVQIVKELVTVLEICPVTTDMDWVAKRGMALVKARNYLRHRA
jgi:hypothetical protein